MWATGRGPISVWHWQIGSLPCWPIRTSKIDTPAITALLGAADQYPGAALLSPRILDDAGRDEPAHDVAMFRRRDYPARAGEAPPDGPCCAEYLSGAVVLLRMSALKTIGPFDEAIFLYYEDDDFCLRLREAGYSAVLVPDAVVNHAGGGWSVPAPTTAGRSSGTWPGPGSISRTNFTVPTPGARLAWPNLGRYALKVLGNALRFDRTKIWRDMARFCGTAGYILAIPASRTTRRARPTRTGSPGR